MPATKKATPVTRKPRKPAAPPVSALEAAAPYAGWAKGKTYVDRDAAVDALKPHEGLQAMIPPNPDFVVEALTLDIDDNGIQDRLKVLPDGTVFDGMTRLAIARKLGLITVPVREYDLTPEEAEDAGWTLNFNRRPLTLEMRQLAVQNTLKAHADWSDRRIAERCGVSPTTVGTYRKAMESAGAVETPEVKTGKGGRKDKTKVTKAAKATAARTREKAKAKDAKAGQPKADKNARPLSPRECFQIVLSTHPSVGAMAIIDDDGLTPEMLPKGMEADHWDRIEEWHRFLTAVVALRP